MRVLEFIPCTLPVLRLLSSDPDEFAAAHGIHLHEVAQSVAQASLEFLKSFPYERRPDHLGYLAVESATQQLIGICGFKGPPESGAVEIAYYTFPGHENRGIATAMAQFLIDRARESAQISTVTACTLPERNASTRILEKLGMTRAGEAEEDGQPVWCWELNLAPLNP